MFTSFCVIKGKSMQFPCWAVTLKNFYLLVQATDGPPRQAFLGNCNGVSSLKQVSLTHARRF